MSPPGLDVSGRRTSTDSMKTNGRPPHFRDTTGGPPVERSDRADAFRRAQESATRGALLRERGDEFGAVTAEMISQGWLQKFAMLNDRLPGGTANQDFPIANP